MLEHDQAIDYAETELGMLLSDDEENVFDLSFIYCEDMQYYEEEDSADT